MCLIPGDANLIKDYRPISLLNCVYKIITRVLTTRLERILQRLIGPDSECIPERKIHIRWSSGCSGDYPLYSCHKIQRNALKT